MIHIHLHLHMCDPFCENMPKCTDFFYIMGHGIVQFFDKIPFVVEKKEEKKKKKEVLLFYPTLGKI